MDLDKLRTELYRDEGIRLKPYRDTVGKLTIGVGRNLQDRGISSEEAFFMLENDIQIVIKALRETYPWFDLINSVRQRALCNMAFNLGMRGLASFRKFLAHMAMAQYFEASREMLLSKWSRQTGQRSIRLSRMIETGEDFV